MPTVWAWKRSGHAQASTPVCDALEACTAFLGGTRDRGANSAHLDSTFLSHRYNESLLEEGKMMHRLRHSRVVKLLGVIIEEGNYSLVMEYMEKGNLMHVLKAEVSIPLSLKGRIIMEIIEGMCYLHGQGIIHKDLKPENILVDDDFHIKIADLGVASFKMWSKLTKEEHNEQRKLNRVSKKNGGTLCYMAPEHLNDINAKPSEKSDVYSFGIVLWAIFANKEPYENAICEEQLIICIKSGNRPNVEDILEYCPEEIISIMKQCWEAKPDIRPTFTGKGIFHDLNIASEAIFS